MSLVGYSPWSRKSWTRLSDFTMFLESLAEGINVYIVQPKNGLKKSSEVQSSLYFTKRHLASLLQGQYLQYLPSVFH